MAMRCPICNHSSHTRTSRYLATSVKEAYYECQNSDCSTTFRTIESVEKVLSSPELNKEVEK